MAACSSNNSKLKVEDAKREKIVSFVVTQRCQYLLMHSIACFKDMRRRRNEHLLYSLPLHDREKMVVYSNKIINLVLR